MLHRKGSFDVSRPLRPIVVTVLDLLAEFMCSHLMRQLPYELYMLVFVFILFSWYFLLMLSFLHLYFFGIP